VVIEIEHSDEYNYGYLTIWLAMSVVIDSYLLGVNPFDQPGVEAYKKRMMNYLKK
jgi:glucose-6-phosphate isomerase